jgi:hypothetical protein
VGKSPPTAGAAKGAAASPEAQLRASSSRAGHYTAFSCAAGGWWFLNDSKFDVIPPSKVRGVQRASWARVRWCA